MTRRYTVLKAHN